MHSYIKTANRLIKHGLVFRPGRMHFGVAAVPHWYARVAKRVHNRCLRRLMFRAGIARRVRKTSYIMARAMLTEFLDTVIETAGVLTEGAGRKTIMKRDVDRALKKRFGMTVYS